MFSHPDTTPESILTEASDIPEWSPLSEVTSTQQGLWSQKFFDPLIGEDESIWHASNRGINKDGQEITKLVISS